MLSIKLFFLKGKSIQCIVQNQNTKLVVCLVYTENSILDLVVTMRSANHKKQDRDLLIARFIDRILRPTLPTGSFHISIIVINSDDNLKFTAIYGAIAAINKIYSLNIAVDHMQCKGFDLLVAGNANELVAIEYNGNLLYKDLCNRILLSLKKCQKIVENDFNKNELNILKKESVCEISLTEENRRQLSADYYLKNSRIDNRELLDYRIHTYDSENQILTKGQTIILGNIFFSKEQDFNITYTFSPFSSGSSGMRGAINRREIGHGKLVTKAFNISESIQIFCEVLSSDGSSSMASIILSSILLHNFDLNAIMGGLSIGALRHDDKLKLIVDLTAEEDNLSEFDFKIAGNALEINVLQLDVKRAIPINYVKEILSLGNKKIKNLIGDLKKTIITNNKIINIDKDLLGKVIGTQGKKIKELEQLTGSIIKALQNGKIIIIGGNMPLAENLIRYLGIKKLNIKDEISFILEEDINGNVINNLQLKSKIKMKKGEIITLEKIESENNTDNLFKKKRNYTHKD